ncbi:GspE/PulE family protein [Gynuella sunshinyii]|uniref:Type II secretory pathway, ATPase PulE/Tfp pilus assembly pathway, ATPase PilB n=1 Tax=Gynuella sunshinyii YC6258 TaxID=1445510 RepID=A0A0C5VF06_9GAMM|nr:GspE/PulE family protein [Gynuella sunshinyii]AJQ97840.1 type II secretory pathway, ATPase PulE/Tfp pilus assembly pathway, ATPase PilB [Gynuella sunshinyii YC6258]
MVVRQRSLIPKTGKLQLRSLIDALVSDGMIFRDAAENALIQPRGADFSAQHPMIQIAAFDLEWKKRPGKKLSPGVLAEWLSEQTGFPYYHIDPLKIDARAVTQVMSFEFAKRQGVLPVEVNEHEVIIATCEPFIRGWEETVEQVTRKSVRKVISSVDDIQRYSVEFFTLAKSVSGATKSGERVGAGIGNFEQLLELGNLKSPDANDEGIINIVDWILQYAFDQRASDIHIEPRREQAFVRFRIDGVLHLAYNMPIQVGMAVTSRIKILGRMNVAEKRKPQDGRLKTKSQEGDEIELRLSTLPTAFGEKLVMRIFDPEVLLRPFEQLGFREEELVRWHKMTAQPNGIIFVTGPTGSGKTTTLYSTLKQLATSEVNVCTIEDPIEMVEPAFNQMQVQHNIELDFADGVKALLRQDPDIIMIGEIRDLETAQMAIQAALTGHLVLSTLHTNDAPTAITRLLDLGVPGYLIKSTVLGVMAQRLVRTLCPHCKQESVISKEDWQQLTHPWNAPPPSRIYRPAGCLECRNTGYLGRSGLYEIFLLTETLGEFIANDVDLVKFRNQAIKEGMHTLRLSGAKKVAAGLTTPEEVMRVTPESRMK